MKELPAGWRWLSPDELASPEKHSLGIGPFGSDLKVSDYVDSGVPLVFVRNIRAESFMAEGQPHVSQEKAVQLAAHRVIAGDVLITKMGEPPGDAAVYPENVPDGRMTADCIRLRVNPAVGTPRFVMYATRAPAVREQIVGATRGVAQKKVSLERYRGVRYPMPPLDEQHRIVAAIETHFSRLDAAVTSLTRAKANLKRARASVLKAAVEGRLVATEAALARAEGRDYEPASALLARILAERKAAWTGSGARGKYAEPVAPETAGLPELPEGWCSATVDQVSRDVRYGTSAKCSEKDLGVAVLRMGNIVDGKLDFTNMKYLPPDHYDFPEQLLQAGELLFNRTNSPELVGKSAVYRGNPSRCACASYLIRVTLGEGVVPEYLSTAINSLYGRRWVKSVVNQQVGQANVNGSKLKAHIFALPPKAEQLRITAEVDRRLSVLDTLEATVDANLARCARLRQAILKQAFEGKLVAEPRAAV